MKMILSAGWTLLLLLLSGTFLLQLIVLESDLGSPRVFLDSAVDAIEDSGASPAVLEDCKTQAGEAGYRLTIEELPGNGRTMYLLTLDYTETAALWNRAQAAEGRIKAYARP